MTPTTTNYRNRFSYHFSPDAWWVRYGRWCLHFKRTEPLFSERYGINNYWHLPFSEWRVNLRRDKHPR